MKHEVVIRLLVQSPVEDTRLVRQLESVFEFGTAGEAIAEGLHLLTVPRLLSVTAERASPRLSRR